MIKRLDSRIFWGVLLILMGTLFMLESLDLVDLTVVWPLLFMLSGLLFLVVFILRQENWWAAIPGFTLLALTVIGGADLIFREISLGDWSGVILLGGITLGFVAIYARTLARQWWALIPAGVLATLSTVIVFESLEILSGESLGGVFLLGLGITFSLVYLSPVSPERQKWAAIPAVILVAMGVLGVVAFTDLLVFVWPIALIILGLYLLLRRPFKKE